MATKAGSKTETNSSTSRKVADAAQEAIEQVAEQAEAAEERVRDAADEANARLHEGAEEALDRGKEVVGSVRALVHEHPVASLGVAFVAGVLIASMLRR